ncbi:BA14K family protein [Mangrovicella endophytica]|uniref:BA14K family protein n=1 Tax=Mangrovicella endophytica TaxID=2066697 RepID=UPI000C9E987B|nr:BA14K family protein [Mangrovicella endophytica]
MRKLLNLALSLTMLGTSIVSFSAPAEAQSLRERQRYVERYCARNPRDSDCRDFRRDARRWDRRRYDRFARDRRDIRGDAAAAAIFGLAAGALIGGAAASRGGAQEDRRHIDRCEARYRSYDARTDTYLGSNGRRIRCTL